MSKLDQALDAVESKDNVDLKEAKVDLSEELEPTPAISTGSPVVDYLIGGKDVKIDGVDGKECPGIPRGRITEIYGPEGSGKTTLALETAVQCQKEGGAVCFLDYENAITPYYAKDLGLEFDSDKFRLIQPRHWEEGAEIIGSMVDAEVDLIIVDSVASMKPKKAIEGDLSDTGQIGHLARKMSDYLPKLVHGLRRADTSLVFLNQVRTNVKTSPYDPGPDEKTPGGRALKFYSSLRLSLEKIKSEYEKKEGDLKGERKKRPVNIIVEAKNTKCKVSRNQGNFTDFVIRFGEGIDNVRSVIDIAKSRDIIEQAGPWYKFVDSTGEERSLQGREETRNFFQDNPEEFQHIANQVKRFTKGEDQEIGDVSDDDIVEVDETGGDE